MKDNDKLINTLIDLGVGMKELRYEMKGMRKDMNALHKEQHKTNILLAEHSRSIIKLAEKINIVADHEKRIVQLEDAISDNGGKTIFMAKEPKAKYKMKKKQVKSKK